MSKNTDTIFALSTPSGKSALAVIRISGKNAFSVINKISSKYTTLINEIEKEHSIDDEKGFDISSRVLIIDGL